MIRNILKRTFYGLLNGISLPAFSKQLMGVKLIVNPLMPTFHFWRNVDIESHFAYDSFIKDNSVIFDVGGNVGLHSSYFAKWFKNTTIYTFEPLPDNVKYFKKIISINQFKNIHVIEKALGAKNGNTFFDKSVNNHQGHITNQPSDLSVLITTLDLFIKEERIIPDFIKIDVEGFEGDVLSGFQETIDEIKPFILIELHSIEQSKKVADFFRPHNYRIFRLENHTTWGKTKPFTELDNTSNLSEVPYGFWGTILALPSLKYEEIAFLVN